MAKLEIRVGGEWVPQRRARVTDRIPGPTGYVVDLAAPCREGMWRTRVGADGAGPDGVPLRSMTAGTRWSFAGGLCTVSQTAPSTVLQ